MKSWSRKSFVHAVATATLLGVTAGSWAQFDPAKVVVEADAVARQFPDPVAPAVPLTTPAFAEGRRDFTSHAEVFGFLDALAGRSPRVALETVGRSQEGRAMALVVLTGRRGFDPRLPTVMLLGQQHGNEPAGGEATLVLAQSLATGRSELLEKVNVLIVPRANPDAAARFGRVSSNGIDVNRDHLLLRTPEAQAITAAVQKYRPQVMLDLHEFTVAGRWVDKFGAVMRYDALLQAAGTANLSPAVQAAQARYMAAASAGIEGAGQRVSDYFTTAPDPRAKSVAMGGVNVDTGRNVGGLRNAVSILLETRGVGLGRAHLARRVQAHVSAATSLIEQAALDGTALVRTMDEAGAATAAQACNGSMAVAVRQMPERRTLNFLDAVSGEPRDIEVDWRSSLSLATVRDRARPCGYLVGGAQAVALQRLRALGVRVERVAGAASTPWDIEDYVVDSETDGQRQDGRGVIADDQGIRVLAVHTQAGRSVPEPDAFYVPMDQPLAGLVSAALEPDSQNSFAANRLMAVDNGQLRRVTSAPPSMPTQAR